MVINEHGTVLQVDPLCEECKVKQAFPLLVKACEEALVYYMVGDLPRLSRLLKQALSKAKGVSL